MSKELIRYYEPTVVRVRTHAVLLLSVSPPSEWRMRMQGRYNDIGLVLVSPPSEWE